MANDTTLHQTARNCHLLQPSCLILKAIALQSGGNGLVTKKQIEFLREHLLGVPSSTR